jgi:hypothetical protein
MDDDNCQRGSYYLDPPRGFLGFGEISITWVHTNCQQVLECQISRTFNTLHAKGLKENQHLLKII